MAKLRLAILSFWHVHANGYVKHIQNRADCDIVAVWDEQMERGEEKAKELGVPFEKELRAVLARADVDGVVVTAPTTMHTDILIAAAEAGKHIFTEKVLALRTADADRILASVQQHQVKLTVSLPRLGDAKTLYAKRVMAQSLLGEVTMIRARLAHDGLWPRENKPQGWLPASFVHPDWSGGGSLIDLGCHPMAIIYDLLGMPDTVFAQFGYVTGNQVEDNAVVTMRYANGTMAVIETGFASKFTPSLLEVYGSDGCLLIGNDVELRSLRLAAAGEEGWLRPALLPPGDALPLDQWLDDVLYDKPARITAAHGRALTQLMEAAHRSANEQRVVQVTASSHPV